MANDIERKSIIVEEIAISKMQNEILGGQNDFLKKKKTFSMQGAKEKGANLIDFMLDLVEALKGKISKVKKKIAAGKKKRKKRISAIKSSMPPIVETLLINILARLLPVMQQKVLDLLMKYLSDNCALDTPNLGLPGGFKTGGLNVSVSNLDIFRILKEDYNSKTGQIFFGGKSSQSFAATLRRAALNHGIPQTYPVVGLAGLIIVKLPPPSKKLIITPNQAFRDFSLKDFFNAMLKKVIPFTPEAFIGLACDKIYGTLSKKIDTAVASFPPSETQARSRDDISNDEYISTIIDNYLQYNLEDIVETDTFYTFSDEQKGIIEEKINSRYQGVGGFMADCGIVEASIPLAVFDQVMDSFTGATKSSETKIIGQALNDLGAAATANLPADDKETGKKGFFRQLIKLLPLILAKMFLSPDVVFLMEIAKAIKTQNIPLPAGGLTAPEVKSGKEFFRQNPQILREMAKEFYGEIMKELYIIVKEEITRLVIIKVKAIVAEKAKNYLSIIMAGVNAQANKALQKAKKLKK